MASPLLLLPSPSTTLSPLPAKQIRTLSYLLQCSWAPPKWPPALLFCGHFSCAFACHHTAARSASGLGPWAFLIGRARSIRWACQSPPAVSTVSPYKRPSPLRSSCLLQLRGSSYSSSVSAAMSLTSDPVYQKLNKFYEANKDTLNLRKLFDAEKDRFCKFR